MLSSISTNSTYLTAVAALAAENKSAGATSAENADAASEALSIQTIKDAIAQALVTNRENTSNAAERIDADVEERREEDMRRLDAFDAKLEAYAGYAASSTDDAPIVRVDVMEKGEAASYLVDISHVDMEKMTRIEALAVMRHMQSDPQWSDITYADMLAAISKLYGASAQGGESADKTPATGTGMAEQIGKYLRSANTYSSFGTYATPAASSSSFIEFISGTGSERAQLRALRLQNLLSKVVTDSSGRRTLAEGVYL